MKLHLEKQTSQFNGNKLNPLYLNSKFKNHLNNNSNKYLKKPIQNKSYKKVKKATNHIKKVVLNNRF